MNRDDILKMEEGEEMDALVAERVMEWHIVSNNNGFKHWETKDGQWGGGMQQGDYVEDEEDFHILHFHPSSSILATMDVLEKLDIPFALGKSPTNNMFYAHVGTIREEAESIPLAVCRVALLLKLEQK